MDLLREPCIRSPRSKPPPGKPYSLIDRFQRQMLVDLQAFLFSWPEISWICASDPWTSSRSASNGGTGAGGIGCDRLAFSRWPCTICWIRARGNSTEGTRLSFLRHGKSFAPMLWFSGGSNRRRWPPPIIVTMSFRRLFLGGVLPSRARLRLPG